MKIQFPTERGKETVTNSNMLSILKRHSRFLALFVAAHIFNQEFQRPRGVCIYRILYKIGKKVSFCRSDVCFRGMYMFYRGRQVTAVNSNDDITY